MRSKRFKSFSNIYRHFSAYKHHSYTFDLTHSLTQTFQNVLVYSSTFHRIQTSFTYIRSHQLTHTIVINHISWSQIRSLSFCTCTSRLCFDIFLTFVWRSYPIQICSSTNLSRLLIIMENFMLTDCKWNFVEKDRTLMLENHYKMQNVFIIGSICLKCCLRCVRSVWFLVPITSFKSKVRKSSTLLK